MLIKQTLITYRLQCDFCSTSVYEESENKVDAKLKALELGFKYDHRKWFCNKCYIKQALRNV